MARYTQLIQLVTMLRQKTGKSSNVYAGIDENDTLKAILRETQEILYDEFDWPHLREEFLLPLAAGQRYYDVPTGLNFDRIETMAVYFPDQPQAVERGIGFAEYSENDSDADERSDPMQKWDIRWLVGGTKEQIEIWPIPASNNQTLKFLGIRKLRDFIEEAALCDLDDKMIVLFAAAEILEDQGSKKAKSVANKAAARFKRMKGRSQAAAETIVYGGGEMKRPTRDHVVIRIAR